MDSSGNIYVADQSNHRVMKWGTTYSDGGTLVAGVSGTSGSGTNQLYNPKEFMWILQAIFMYRIPLIIEL